MNKGLAEPLRIIRDRPHLEICHRQIVKYRTVTRPQFVLR
jgi:hypothetical protein